MSAGRPEDMIQRYLDRVAGQLHDLSAEERSEILSDLRAHIEEAVGDPETAPEADVRNVLERLGEPVDLARESRDRRSDDASNHVPDVYRRVNKSPGALEIAAIVLTALVWPIGVVLAWLSPRWLVRDKVIATILPIFSLVLLIGAMVPAWVGYGSSRVVTTEPQSVQSPSESGVQDMNSQETLIVSDDGWVWSSIGRLIAILVFLVGVVGGPFIAAIYLAIRLQPSEDVLVPDRYPESQTRRIGQAL